MTYDELKEWLTDWISNRPDQPIPLIIRNFAISHDIRTAINVNIERIEAIPPEKRKNSNQVLRSYKTRLEEIKTAIEVGNHDISKFGYRSKYNNYLP